ncbi:LacI family DNA-binding transcriptional regulator [Granulicella arctica]|uniref:LacI family DNA-binding transcriptional regulator n=1 Tax=Granulicella arctica TaxID=940613 RepID=UPI0021E01615|nr:LacI family DNA-binding transcriptional regulator [Granulicella arctica]
MGLKTGVTLGDIASKLGLSISTVSRALQDHSGLSAETKARVLAASADLGYRPNLAARSLVSGRTLRIAVNTPQEILSVYDLVRKGIRDEAEPFLAMGVELVDFTFPRLGEGEAEAFEGALDAGVDGVILVPGAPASLKNSFARAASMKVPVVCLLTDAPSEQKLSTVCVNAVSCGALAGELMSRLLPAHGSLAVTTGDLKVTDHQEKFSSFERCVQRNRADTLLYDPIENHESESEAYERTLAFLNQHRDLGGLYISTGNGAPALRAVEDAGLLGKLTIFSTNLFREVVPQIRLGTVAGTFYERPYSHGRIAFSLLYKYLSTGIVPPPRVSLEPFLIMRGNLDCFVHQQNHPEANETDRGSIESILLGETLASMQ